MQHLVQIGIFGTSYVCLTRLIRCDVRSHVYQRYCYPQTIRWLPDHPQSGVVYNFVILVVSVCLYLRMSVRR